MDIPYIELTATDRQILNSYALMLDGLGAYLGEGYELVLHSLESLDHSVIKIINGHYTGAERRLSHHRSGPENAGRTGKGSGAHRVSLF